MNIRACGGVEELKPYSDYEDSGQPWLGKVPGHWTLARPRTMFAKADRPVRPEDEVVTCFRDGTVTLRKNRRLRGYTEAIYELGYQGIRKGDLVIHAMDAFAGAIGVSDSDGKGSPIYGVCVPKSDANPHYYAHVVREMSRTRWILALARGIRERSTDFRFESFATQYVPVPPPAEQAAIVRFLSALDRRVNRFVRAKRRLIELLTEQKQALITHAVTRGLNSNAKRKPSGIDWLGDVPEHWDTLPLRRLATKFGSGVTPRGGATVYREEGVPFLRSQNIQFEGLSLSNVARIAPELHAALSGTHVRPKDVLLNITGASIGRVCYVPDDFDEGNVSQHVCIIRPIQNRISANFLAAFLSTSGMQREIYVEQNGASREGLTLASIRGLRIIVPPLDEQSGIVEMIARESVGIERGIDLAHREIALLREYHMRLVSDVVTGKLDVRAAARLPEEDHAGLDDGAAVETDAERDDSEDDESAGEVDGLEGVEA